VEVRLSLSPAHLIEGSYFRLKTIFGNRAGARSLANRTFRIKVRRIDMHDTHRLLVALSLCALMVVPYTYGKQEATAPVDQLQIRQQVEDILQQVDSDAFASLVSTDEFIVTAFQLIKNRDPLPFEFHSLKHLQSEHRTKRSTLLASLLAGDDSQISWEECRRLLKSDPVSSLKNTAPIRALAQSLANTTRQEMFESYQKTIKVRQTTSPTTVPDASSILPKEPYPALSASSAVPNETYNTYFGFLHSHTGLSDGEGTPEEAYQYARDVAGMDIFAVSDHGELISTWPWNNEWNRIKAAANANYQPGSYVTLWGFEYSNFITGHINVLNTNDFTSLFSSIGIGDFYNWLNVRPDGFGTFNHPGKYDDLGVEFLHFDITDTAVITQMVGVETWNGAGNFDQYYYQNTWSSTNGSYLDTGNQKGWFFGALGAGDNHQRGWGTTSDYRTGVLAKSLTREDVIEAYRARRFYATEDKDLHLDFRCSGYPMGSQLTAVPRIFTVTATDGSGDTLSEVRLYRNGTLIAVNPVSGNSINTAFTDNATGRAYYYVMVKENDDQDGNGRNDEALSSSIWVQ
jgi:hypothetical protein